MSKVNDIKMCAKNCVSSYDEMLDRQDIEEIPPVPMKWDYQNLMFWIEEIPQDFEKDLFDRSFAHYRAIAKGGNR